MQIKTFRALDMREALRAIKAELGPEAVILSSQEVKKGTGVFGLFSRAMVEVTAAVDRPPESPRSSVERPGWNRDVQEGHAAILSHGRLPDGQEKFLAPPPAGASADTDRPTKGARAFVDHMQSATEMQLLKAELSDIKYELGNLRDITAPIAAAHESWKGLKDDMRTIQRLIGAVAKNEQELFIQRLSPSVRAAYDWLVDTGIDMPVVLDLTKQLQDRHARERQPVSDEQMTAALRDLIARQVLESVRCAGPVFDAGVQDSTKVVMIVGPTGVGKTTTIAKLAAYYALQHKRKVALITLDTYRVAAVEQLRVYGNILGLAVEVALTCEDLAGILRHRQNADLILIDTAGRSPLDQAALRELKKLVVLNRQVEAHLVLSAATRESDLDLVLPRFATLPVKSLIFSKLDETTKYGMLFTVLHRTRLPVSYLSTGQRVPEDLVLASPTLIADLLLDGLAGIKSRIAVDTLPRLAQAPPAPRQAPRLSPPGGAGPRPESAGPSPEVTTLLSALGRAFAIRGNRK